MSQTPSSSSGLSRRDIFLVGSALTGLATAAGSIFVKLEQKVAREREAFLNELRTSPLSGKIAYVDGHQIKILSAKALPDSIAPIKTFQVEQYPKLIAWISPDEVVFAAQAYKENVLGTPRNPERKFEFTIVSDGLFKLDSKTGTVAALFDPYSNSATKVFGNIQEADPQEERRLEEFMNEKEVGTRVVWGNHAKLTIKHIGTVDSGASVLFSSDDLWYEVNLESRQIKRCEVIPPNILIKHEKISDRGLVLIPKDELFGKTTLQLVREGKHFGIDLQEGSSLPAYIGKE